MIRSIYIKIFISFILLAFVLMFFNFSSFSKFYTSSMKESNIETIKYKLQKHEIKINKYIENKKNLLINLSSLDISNELLSFVMNNNQDILRIKIFNLEGKEKIVLNKHNNKHFFTNEKDLLDNSIFDEYRKIRTLKDGAFWISKIKPLKLNEEIIHPIVPIIDIVLRNENSFISFSLDIKDTFLSFEENSFFDLYILDKKGEFIVHKNSQYNYSKFFSSKFSLDDLEEKYFSSILKIDNLQKDDFLSKRFYYDNSEYFIFYLKYNQQTLLSFINNFSEFNNSNIMIFIIITLVLATLLTEPIVSFTKKVIERNKSLNLNFEKNSSLLNKSLKTIDKFVLTLSFDKHGKIIDLSEAFCESSGYLKSELIGFSFKKIIHKDESYRTFLRYIIDLRKGITQGFEIKFKKKSGSFFWVDIYCEPVFNEKRELIMFNVVGNNISDKITIQNLFDDINNQVSQYNAIFENVNSGIALIDKKGQFKKVNSSLIKLLGYSKKDFLKINCFDIINDSSKNTLKNFIDKLHEINSISNLEKSFIHKDGRDVFLEMSLSLLDDNQHLVLVLNSLEDKRKLQELNENLNKKVNEELEKSRQKDKIHQEEQIRSAKLSSIGSLAAGITHEINTPLTYIKGNFEMMGYDIEDLPDSNLKQRMLEDKEKISDGINRIANIVESMREISQSSKEEKEEINIYSTLITSLTMAYNRSKQISKIYLNDELFCIDSVNKNKFVYKCLVQKQRVEQVWIIIINNALDELIKIDNYEQRKLKIDVYENDNEIIIDFLDNAGGIPKDIIYNIFDAFVSTKEQGGMGVGLNIAKKIIEEQKGIIEASNKDNGALFQVRLKK